MKRKLSVVISCKVPSFTLEYCLESLTRQWPLAVEAEIFVVDDGSNRDYEPHTKDLLPPAVVLRAGTRRDAPANRNMGAAQATADIVAFIGDDCMIPLGWTDSILEYMDSHPELMLVGGQFRSNNQRNIFVRAGEDFAVTSQLFDGVPRVAGNQAFVRREVFEQFGGFNENLDFARRNPWELSERMQHQGYGVAMADSIYCYRNHPATLRLFLGRPWREGFWGGGEPGARSRSPLRTLTSSGLKFLGILFAFLGRMRMRMNSMRQNGQ